MVLAIVTGAAREGANRTHSYGRISCGVTCASPVAACVVTDLVPWNGTVPGADPLVTQTRAACDR
jgi:hypothetical protein